MFFGSLPFFLNQKRHFYEQPNKVDLSVFELILPNLTNTLGFGNPSFSDKINTFSLDAIIEHILSTKRFTEPLSYMKHIIQDINYILLVFNDILLS